MCKSSTQTSRKPYWNGVPYISGKHLHRWWIFNLQGDLWLTWHFWPSGNWALQRVANGPKPSEVHHPRMLLSKLSFFRQPNMVGSRNNLVWALLREPTSIPKSKHKNQMSVDPKVRTSFSNKLAIYCFRLTERFDSWSSGKRQWGETGARGQWRCWRC